MIRWSLYFCIALLIFSCKKDPEIIFGCTDENAVNWTSLANFDD
jgi:hypothetical protein